MKRLLSIALSLCLALSLLTVPSLAASKEGERAAAQLHEAGLLYGTDEGTDELERSLTRQEAAALLVRLAEREDEALAGSWYLPFDDVDAWAEPYVGYACANGFLDAAAPGRFDGGNAVTGSEFRTGLLRALGYVADVRYERTGIPVGTDAALSREDAAVMTLAAAGMAGLSLWTEGVGTPRRVLEAYMEAITDETGVDYIPVENRIAVFDLDGTLFCETDPMYFDHMLYLHRVFDDPGYQATEEQLRVGEMVREVIRTGVYPGGLDTLHAQCNAEAFAGMSVEEYMAYAAAYMAEETGSYMGMNRGDAFYEPMLQLIRFLQHNDFTVYIVSGTNRIEVRALVQNVIDIPAAQVIGTDEWIVASGQDGKDGLEYIYGEDDHLVMKGSYIAKNLKMNKVSVIAREIGKQPVLSFGNSSGDASMANYVITDNPYRSAAFQLCCDDLVRENGNEKKAESMRESCEKNGWVAVSMRDHWNTIYGVGVMRVVSSAQAAATYSLADVHAVSGRQGIAAEGESYWVSGSTTLTKYDSAWNVLAENNEPFTRGYENEVNHIGDIDVYQNEVYCGVELFLDGVAKNIQIAVYDGDTLQLKRTFNFEPASGQTEVSGIAVDAENRSVWLCSWAQSEEGGDYLYQYDLDSGAYLGKVRMMPAPQLIQGVACHDGYFYVTADDGDADKDEPDTIYCGKIVPGAETCAMTVERKLTDVTRQGEIEGLTFDEANNQMLVVYNRGARIILGMPTGFYEGYDHEIHEAFVYDIR